MELITLDSDFQPEKLVESYESLIWTERYSSFGDFEIKSTNVHFLVNALKKGTVVSLRESTVPMVVEDHKVTKPARAAPFVTVTGRTFETVLERRASVNSSLGAYSDGIRKPWLIDARSSSEAAYRAIRRVIGDVARYDVTGSQLVLEAIAPAVSPLDAIPELDLPMPVDYNTQTPSAWSSSTAYVVDDFVLRDSKYWVAIEPNTNQEPSEISQYWRRSAFEIPPKELYTTVMELLAETRRGFKSVRPTPETTKISLEIYNGANLTGEGDNSDPNDVIVFDAKFDQFEDANYFLSERGSANVAYVFGSDASQLVLKTTAPEPSGLSRRVLLVDQSGDASVNSEEVRRSRGLIELYQRNVLALFDGQIAEQVAKGYNTRYHLGDILKLSGEFGLSQNVRVSEYIRSHDATGFKAFPTFEAIED